MERINDSLSLFKEIASVVAPPPDLKVSDWADLYRKLSSESSSEPGQWRTDRAPYQREIMNAVNDPEIETIVVMSSSQVGKTELLLNTIGYHIDYDPAPIMVMQPTVEMAKTFSKDRLSPMIRDTPALQGTVSDSKSRDSGNTVLHKTFPGGHITMVGANSPAGLASRPIRILLADEVDRFPASAGSEGDPLTLAEKRTTTFWNRKKIYVSTPTIKGVSRIEAAYENSTKERWNLPCPSCGELQPLRWAQINFDTVEMACKECGTLHNEFEWKSGEGDWVAENPNHSVRGFHLNELASPWKRWSQIIQDFKEAKQGGQEMLKAWVNTSLGETWEEDAGEQLDEMSLFERSEDYDARVPDGVKILTAAVDVQDDRFEIEVVGWGKGKESWGIEYHRIYGDLNQPQVWGELDEYLSRTWEKEDGARFGIACTCIDSGGHFTQEVYRFTGPREARRIYAIKGKGGQNGEYVPLINGFSRVKPGRTMLISLGVSEGKAKVASNLKIFEEGPGYCHFPKEFGYNLKYFEGLTAEKLQTKYRSGIAYQTWVKTRDRNEPFDLRVYNTAALEILNPSLDKEYTVTPKKQKKKRSRVLSKGVSL